MAYNKKSSSDNWTTVSKALLVEKNKEIILLFVQLQELMLKYMGQSIVSFLKMVLASAFAQM